MKIKYVIFNWSFTSYLIHDHLGEILRIYGQGSVLENMCLHCTKCSKLILKIVSPALVGQLVLDVGDNGYSLIVNESTDISISKYMAYCIRYYSKSLNRITNEFLGLVIIERATAETLKDGTLEFLKMLNISPENMVGLGVDGASNLCEKNNSLFTLLQEISPNLQLIKCVCHSLNTKASTKLPSHIPVEYLLRESVLWFSHSSLKQIEYNRLFLRINGDGAKQKKLVKLCATRWHVFYNCTSVILEQWLELKSCFEMAT